MPPAVHLRDALALIGSFPALAGVDLDVDPGEVVLVQGANGAGKTSLLRACAGLLAIQGGEAVVLGQDLARDRRAVRRQVGMLGHATFLYDDLSIADNVRFAVRAAGGRAGAVEGALAQVGLDGRLAGVRAARLSAGQRRRVALAVLLARRPPLWLLDEPHAGLDAAGRDLLDQAVRTAVAAGVTVLLASHETDRALVLAHRALTMAGGRVIPPPLTAAQPRPLAVIPVGVGAPAGAAPPPGMDGRRRGGGPRRAEEAGVGAPAGAAPPQEAEPVHVA